MPKEVSIDIVLNSADGPDWRVPITWRALMAARIDLALRANVTAVLCLSFVAMLTAALPLIAMVVSVFSLGPRFGVIVFVALCWIGSFLVIWISGHLHDRMHVKPASPSAIRALRTRIAPRHWEFVQAKAAAWLAQTPHKALTIWMILRWYDEAVEKDCEAGPPYASHNAMRRAQEQAFS
jgi:hypothetical protein